MNEQQLYRRLLRMFPRDLQAEYGAEMERLFLEELAATRGPRRWWLWARVIADACRHGIGSRLDAWTRFRKTLSYVEYEPWRWWMDTLRYDLRHALRLMFRQSGTTAIIVLTLALAIGANTAVFSAVHAALLRPLPYSQPERLVQLWEKREAEGVMKNSVSSADYLDWARLNQSFTTTAAFTDTTVDLTGEGEPERIAAAAVSASFFDLLGIRALHGRTFAPGEDAAGRERVVVLGHALWRQRFGADPGVIGRSIMLNGTPRQVIGIMAPDVRFPNGEAQIFVPLVLNVTDPMARAIHQLIVYGRLKPAVTIEQARAEMDRIGKDLEAQYPTLSRGHGAHVTALGDEVVLPVRRTLIVLMSAVGFILLIACINVTNLLLARSAGRRREMAVRAAIGAGRSRLVRQVLVECVVLAAAGSLAGLLLAMWVVQLLAVQMPPVTRPDLAAVFSAPVLLFALAVCFVAALLAGALPAWHMVREDPAEPLKEGGRSPVSLRRRLRFGLIVAEVALTSLLLVGAGLILRSFERVLSEDPGFETAGRLTFQITPPRVRYPNLEAMQRLFADLEARLASEPTIRQVGATFALPLSGGDRRYGIEIEGRDATPEDGPTRAHLRSVSSAYLQTIGARLREGRGFAPTDAGTALPVTIVNETMARRYWPGASPIGKRLRLSNGETWWEVVGVVADVKHWGLDNPVNPEMYLPVAQFTLESMTFVVATDGDPLALVPLAQRHVRELDASLPLFQVRTMDEVAARSMERRRWTMLLLACFALVALALAAAGIYGVMSHLVALRTPEIGIRLTLGASPFGVMRQVLGEAVAQAGVGLALGLAASVAVMQGIRAFLFGVEPTDPLTLAAVAITLLTVAILAVAVPAMRAMRIDPVSALRSE